MSTASNAFVAAMLSLALTTLAGPSVAADTVTTLRFSATAPGTALPSGWKPYAMSRHHPAAHMRIVRGDHTNVLSIDADAAAGAVAHHLNLSAATTLTWRWKVDHSVAKADLSRKSGDDFAARVYVFFDVPRSQLSWLQRLKLGVARRTLGHAMPTAALCYVWDNHHRIGTIARNPYFGQVRTIVLQSGDAQAGTWQTQRRNLAADFRAAFGRAAPRVTGIALASDTDNTRSRAHAWFGDLTLTAQTPAVARKPKAPQP